MRDWKKLIPSNNFQELIDLFNANSDSSDFLDRMTGSILSNGVLYQDKETIDGMLIRPLTKVDLTGQVQSNTILDNFTLYYRDTNKLVTLDRFPIDLLSYADGKIHFLYIREDLSYRVSDYMFGYADEILLARFVINIDSTWNHFYIMAQRAGTPMYNAADEFYTIDGMYVKSPGGLELSQTSGTVKRSGIDFTDKVSPDIFQFYNLASERVPIRYVNTSNEIDYTQPTTWNIITDKYMTYNLDKKKKIQAERFITNIKNLYYMIEIHSNDVADELHSSIVSGAEQSDLKQIVSAYVDYINAIYGEVTNLYDLLGDSALSSVGRDDLLANKNLINAYISANLNIEEDITESQVSAIRTVPCYIKNINPTICSNPLEIILQNVQDDLDDISFNIGTIGNVPRDKFTIQRVLWDIYEKTLILQYGDTIYDTFDDAVEGTGLLQYPAPFGKTVYIPLAIIVLKSGITDLNEDLDSIIIDRRWTEVDQEQSAYADYVARAYASKALQMIQGIIGGDIPAAKADSLKYTSGGNTYYADGDFYLEYGNLRNRVQVINDTTHDTYNSLEALSAYQGKVLNDKFNNYLPLAGGTLTGTLNARSITPTSNNSYDLGSSSNRWSTVYANALNSSGGLTTGGAASIGGTLNVTGKTTLNGGLKLGGSLERSDGGIYVYSSDSSIINVKAGSSLDINSQPNGTLIFTW